MIGARVIVLALIALGICVQGFAADEESYLFTSIEAPEGAGMLPKGLLRHRFATIDTETLLSHVAAFCSGSDETFTTTLNLFDDAVFQMSANKPCSPATSASKNQFVFSGYTLDESNSRVYFTIIQSDIWIFIHAPSTRFGVTPHSEGTYIVKEYLPLPPYSIPPPTAASSSI